MLKERFESPQQIINALMEGLLKVSSFTGDHPRLLRAVTRDAECYFRTIWEYVNTAMFPSEIRLRIAQETRREAWKVTP